MKVRHLVVVKVENCNPQRSDEIVRECLRQWKRKTPRDEMVRIDRGSASDPSACIIISAWIDLPGDFGYGMAGDFDIRLARAIWMTNGGYCFVEVLAKHVYLIPEDFSIFPEEDYEDILGHRAGDTATKSGPLPGHPASGGRVPTAR